MQHTPMQGSASVNASCTPPVMGIIGRGYVRMIPATSTAECCSACLNDGGCVAYTLSGGSLCFLKDNIDVVSTTATDHHSGAPSPTFYPPSSILLLCFQLILPQSYKRQDLSCAPFFRLSAPSLLCCIVSLFVIPIRNHSGPKASA